MTAVAAPGAGAVGEAVEHLRPGGLLVQHDARRDQGDVAAAQLTTAETVSAMMRRGGDLVSVVVTPRRACELSLRPAPVVRVGGRAWCERTPTAAAVEARTRIPTGSSSREGARDPAREHRRGRRGALRRQVRRLRCSTTSR